ncbi:MAG: hypothetical protein CTY31_12290 [Hyphomicrobium sp.]|nr:MAG: hypothetical protein CTY39_08100 [Hyphomicrobium sp.]PPC98791.1 MAG: hypothetical protein CTY31_12290 [Hyphomicrobium sp.]
MSIVATLSTKSSLSALVRNSDVSVAAFIQHLRCVELPMPFRADHVWELYADWFSEVATRRDEPLTRGQLFRQIGPAGLRRRRETTGKTRRYRYQLTNVLATSRSTRRNAGPQRVHGPTQFDS